MHCGGRGGNRIFYKVQPFSLQYARPAPKLIHKLSTKSGKPASAALCAAFCGNVCGSPLQSSDSELFVFRACGLEDGPDSDAVAQDKHFGVELITHGAAQHLQEGAFRSGIGTGHACHGALSDMQVSVGLGVAGGAIAIAAAASVQLSAVFEMKAEAAVGIGNVLPVELDELPLRADERGSVEPLVLAAGTACCQEEQQCGQ